MKTNVGTVVAGRQPGQAFLAVLCLGVAWSSVLLTAQTVSAPHVVKVVGEGHKLVLMSDGTLVGWGNVDAGQLGPVAAIPSRNRRATRLVTISLPGKAVDVAAASDTSYALLDAGTVVAWGRGTNGELGAGASGTAMKGPNGSVGSETPVRVSSLSNVVQIVAANRAALALLGDGTVWAWGSRRSGMLGDGRDPKRYGESAPDAPSPVRVPNVSNITRIAVGGDHVLVLSSDGRVFTWGSNYCGALGRAPRQELPMDEAGEVPGLTGVVAIAGGTGVSSAVKKDGTVWVWGANWHGQFGNGERTDPPGVSSGYELVPRQVPGVRDVVAISLAITGRHTLVLLKDGTLRGWGNSDWGQIGAGVSGDFQPSPVTPRIAGVKAVFAAGNNSFAVRTDDTFWIWGSGDRGEWPLAANTKVPTRLELKER
jgi:alpha-tubulin suppressor-like RCC1 family protein